MNCPNCGGKLPNGSKFCSICGKKVSSVDLRISNEQNVTNVYDSKTGVSENILKHEDVQHSKKISCKKIIGVTVAVVVIMAVILGVKVLFLDSTGDNMVAYLSEGNYKLITDLEKERTIEFESSQSDAAMESLLGFSPDGKYLYYYTKYDSYSGNATLCRAEYGKLKKNSNKNNKQWIKNS